MAIILPGRSYLLSYYHSRQACHATFRLPLLNLVAAAKLHRLDGRTIHSYTQKIKRYYLVWAGAHTYHDDGFKSTIQRHEGLTWEAECLTFWIDRCVPGAVACLAQLLCRGEGVRHLRVQLAIRKQKSKIQ